MKKRITLQHYDLAPGAVVEVVESDPAMTGLFGAAHVIVKTEKGWLASVPEYKLAEIIT